MIPLAPIQGPTIHETRRRASARHAEGVERAQGADSAEQSQTLIIPISFNHRYSKKIEIKQPTI
jgi:hypothetical protein